MPRIPVDLHELPEAYESYDNPINILRTNEIYNTSNENGSKVNTQRSPPPTDYGLLPPEAMSASPKRIEITEFNSR